MAPDRCMTLMAILTKLALESLVADSDVGPSLRKTRIALSIREKE